MCAECDSEVRLSGEVCDGAYVRSRSRRVDNTDKPVKGDWTTLLCSACMSVRLCGVRVRVYSSATYPLIVGSVHNHMVIYIWKGK